MAQQAKIEEYSGTELITLDEARDYLRVDHTDDNAYITELIKIARMQVFNDTNTAVVETEITEYFDKFPSDGIITLRYAGELANSPVITYYNSDNTLSTLNFVGNWQRVSNSGMPTIQFYNTPSLYDRQDAISLHYHVKPQNDDSIRTLKIAMYLLIGHFYDNRSAVTFGSPKELPIGYQRIINQYKNYMW